MSKSGLTAACIPQQELFMADTFNRVNLPEFCEVMLSLVDFETFSAFELRRRFRSGFGAISSSVVETKHSAERPEKNQIFKCAAVV